MMEADENTRMMIQLASMMMQNQTAMRETQTQLEAAASRETSVEPNGSQNKKQAPSPTALQSGTNPATFGMDPKLMAEFARQIVMNANNLAGQDTAQKRNPTEKPATIAQIIQSQQKGQSTTAKNTSEGKIFVYNQLPDANVSQTNGDLKPDLNTLAAAAAANGTFQHSSTSGHTSTIGPIRNKYGRVLRPGIDNFGRFEAVANPGLIMHAMELLRQKDKKKRGPKEKETFSVFMYCLPDKNSKLPKFSSLDPIERALVDQHQQEGYGYPSQDYINGIPRKTQLCLSFDEKKFHGYMVALYPKLGGRLYDMYRIDKTRRLIRVEAHSPRQLKDMKYQGSLIVIPYDTQEDRPAAVIHRNFDDVYNNNSAPSLGNPLALMQNFNIPLTSLPELVPEVSVNSKVDTKRELPVFPGQPLPVTTEINGKGKENGSCCPKEDMETNSEVTDIDSDFDDVKILQMARDMRQHLKETKHIHIRPDSLFTDILNAYREDTSLEKHKISVCFQPHNSRENGCVQNDDRMEPSTVFVSFWEEAFRNHFTGTHHLVPLLDPSSSNDFFQICGRILVHGLVFGNYFPIRFSPACLAALVTESCSDQLALTSFYQAMSESEKDVLETAIAELKSGAENYSAKIERCVKVVLGSYGCKNIPESFELDAAMISIAKTYLLYQPHWSLCQVRAGMSAAGFDLAELGEEDVIQLYQHLTPSVPTILQRVCYHPAESSKSEDKVKVFFEQYLHKISRNALQKFLQQWCGFDCLCVRKLTVKFTDDESVSVFTPKDNTVHLPQACTSLQEMSQVFEIHVPTITTESRNAWEYTL
ncbi:uncharacterized protein LOC123552120 [Mercenaria mercenaria]|uniref:uncharacterized protein LOC123552120 n=1 Tax=Mercenaria mercenaria TaxID=6596 RepID=UPI00234F2571|nr:uncharacterized protein LOC123552120 [Mercenaria mercenaria]XP_045197449.2 uncharacterized protein LOC123552120 [Mercenaria mercenaria]